MSSLRLVVTGTRRKTRPDVGYWLDRWARKHGKPALVVVGDAPGVDAAAEEHCDEREWPSVRIVVNPLLQSPWKFHERNERMVRFGRPGDHLLAFPDDESRGTWHCHGLAKRAGLSCFVLPLHKVAP